jgi:hypothetical protein
MKRSLYLALLLAAMFGVAFFWFARPTRKLAAYGFPSLPSGSVVEQTYSLGGFSVVYMARVSLPPGSLPAYADSFTWTREIIGDAPGQTRVLTPESFDSYMKTADLSTKLEVRENYPETFSWWTPQVITRGVLIKKEGEGLVRRAYIDSNSSVAYLIYQKS